MLGNKASGVCLSKGMPGQEEPHIPKLDVSWRAAFNFGQGTAMEGHELLHSCLLDEFRTYRVMLQ